MMKVARLACAGGRARMSQTDEVEVLLVEDSENDAELTLRALKKHNLANKVLWVKDGAEALDFLIPPPGGAAGKRSGRPRVVLLDLKLPKVDGLEVLRKVKADPRTKTIPVVALTSSTEDRHIVECYKLGVNSYIVKPVEFDKFTKAVAELGLYWMIMNQPPR